MQITISNLAKEDLIDIWLYGHKVWGESLADRYLDDLYGAISSLSSSPFRNPFISCCIALVSVYI
jgi:plasmid stabilization system protein ParE